MVENQEDQPQAPETGASETEETKNETSSTQEAQAQAAPETPSETKEKTAEKAEEEKKTPADKNPRAGRRGGRRNDRRDAKPGDGPKGEKDPNNPEVMEKVIAINRITKVTKGGKKLSFRALVVVGDTMGKVGYSCSKASEVAIAIRKALTVAKRNMVKIPMRGSTIPHEIIGECAGAEVLLKPAGEGTGVIASGPVRAVCDGAGIHNILTKCHRSNNPVNVVKATFDGLLRLKTVQK